MHQELMGEGDKEFVKEKQLDQESTMVKEETVEYVEGYSIAPEDEGKIALASGANQRNPDMDKSTSGTKPKAKNCSLKTEYGVCESPDIDEDEEATSSGQGGIEFEFVDLSSRVPDNTVNSHQEDLSEGLPATSISFFLSTIQRDLKQLAENVQEISKKFDTFSETVSVRLASIEKRLEVREVESSQMHFPVHTMEQLDKMRDKVKSSDEYRSLLKLRFTRDLEAEDVPDDSIIFKKWFKDALLISLRHELASCPVLMTMTEAMMDQRGYLRAAPIQAAWNLESAKAKARLRSRWSRAAAKDDQEPKAKKRKSTATGKPPTAKEAAETLRGSTR